MAGAIKAPAAYLVFCTRVPLPNTYVTRHAPIGRTACAGSSLGAAFTHCVFVSLSCEPAPCPVTDFLAHACALVLLHPP